LPKMTGVVKKVTRMPLRSKHLPLCKLLCLFTEVNRQDRLQRGYIELAKALSWLHNKLADLDHEDSDDMLKKVFNNIVTHLAHFAHFNLAQARRGLSSGRRHRNSERTCGFVGEHRVLSDSAHQDRRQAPSGFRERCMR